MLLLLCSCTPIQNFFNSIEAMTLLSARNLQEMESQWCAAVWSQLSKRVLANEMLCGWNNSCHRAFHWLELALITNFSSLCCSRDGLRCSFADILYQEVCTVQKCGFLMCCQCRLLSIRDSALRSLPCSAMCGLGMQPRTGEGAMLGSGKSSSSLPHSTFIDVDLVMNRVVYAPIHDSVDINKGAMGKAATALGSLASPQQ